MWPHFGFIMPTGMLTIKYLSCRSTRKELTWPGSALFIPGERDNGMTEKQRQQVEDNAAWFRTHAAWKEHVDGWDEWWKRCNADQVDQDHGADHPAREREWLVNAHISRENTFSNIRTFPVPPTARQLTRERDKRTSAIVQVLPGGVRVKRHVPGPEPVKHAGGGVRGWIAGFSGDSRRRLIQKLMALDWSRFAVFFVTLTWHENISGDFRDWKNALAKFTDRLNYRYGVKLLGLLWRLEFAVRKSGLHKGSPAPHFHCVVFWNTKRGPDMTHFREWVASNWHEIADPESEQHAKASTQVLKATNCRGRDMSKLLNYLAKYVGKVERFRLVDVNTGELMRSGRIWGEQGELPYVVIGAFELDRGQYLQFLGSVNAYGEQVNSWYCRAITDQWRGFSIMGDGCELVDRLCHDIDLAYLPGSARGAL